MDKQKESNVKVKENGKKWLFWFSLGVAIILVYKAVENFAPITDVVGTFFNIITPFLAGIFIAYILYMPCMKIERAISKIKIKFISKRARGSSILIVYLIILLILVILINVILPVVFESVKDLINNIQYYYEMTMERYNNLPEDSFLKSGVVNEAIQNIQHIDIRNYIDLNKILEYVVSAISAVTGIFDIVVAIIVSIYILSERTRILTFVKKLMSAIFKERTYKNIDKYYNHSNAIFFKFIASQFMDAVIVGILTTIAMSLMGVRYAPLLGFLIGLFNMIPYIGAIIAVFIAGLITLITGGLYQTIWMLIVVIILQQIDANIINPRIVGHNLKISPLLVIFAITIGGAYFGILGMFLAVPIVAVIKIITEDYIDYKLAVKKIKSENVKIHN